MIKVFISSTFRDLEKERKLLSDKLKPAILSVGMEDFFPDGKTSQEIAIKKLKDSDIVIFLVSPYYGSFLNECKVKDCKEECTIGEMSYTHCEYKVALADNKPHQVYIIDKGWDIIKILNDWETIDWRQVNDNSVFNGLSSYEIEHYFNISKKVWRFKEEAQKEFCPKIDIDDINTIAEHLAINIGKWYSEGRLNLEDFCGRKKELKDLLEKMDESVEVYGVGGIGKTTLIHIALSIQSLKGKKIVTVGTRQSYSSGSGYKNFRENFKKDIHEIIGNNITLEDIITALSIPDEIRTKNINEKINEISKKIENENIILFIDDFHLADQNVKDLVKNLKNIVLSSKKNVGVARNEMSLSGIEKNDRDKLIELISHRLDKKLDPKAKEIINRIAEGHPVSTEMLVRNYDKINFEKLETFKDTLNFSNSEHIKEFIKRVVEEIFGDNNEALNLLKCISLINTDLETNIDKDLFQKISQIDNFTEIFNELIDTGMLKKKKNKGEIYDFSFNHIKEAISDESELNHKKIVKYYVKKIDEKENIDESIELFFHKIKSNSIINVSDEYYILASKASPATNSFNRLIKIGEEIKNTLNHIDKLSVTIEIGNLYRKLNRYENAEKILKESLVVVKKLKKENPIIYLPSLATVFINLGAVYRNLSKHNDAERTLLKALNIYRKLSQENQDIFLLSLIMTLNNLSNLYFDITRYKDAENVLLEAKEKFEEIEKEDPDVYLIEKATILRNLANLYSETQRLKESKELYKKTLDINRKLAKENPHIYLNDVATTLNELGVLYRYLKKYEDAEISYNEGIQIIRDFIKSSPNSEAYLPLLSDLLNNRGALYLYLNRHVDAIDSMIESIELIKIISKKNTRIYGRLMGSILNLGSVYLDLRDYENSKKFIQEAIDIKNEICIRNEIGINYSPHELLKIANVLGNIGVKYKNLGKYKSAEKIINEVLVILNDLKNEPSEAGFTELAKTYGNLANVYVGLNKDEEAEKAYEKSLNYFKNLVKENSDAYLDELALTLNNLGIFYSELKRYEDSERILNEVPVILNKTKKKPTETHLSELAKTYATLANVYGEVNREEEAEKAYKKSLNYFKNLVTENSDTYLDQLSLTLNNLGIFYFKSKRYGDAEKPCLEALHIQRRLAKKNPETYLSYLAETLYCLINVYSAMKNTVEYEKILKEINIIYEKLQENTAKENADL